MASKTFSVIDIETTGGQAKNDRITEIAIVNYRNGEVIDSFSSLVNPERSIPTYITRITGITNEMVAEAPKFFEVAREVVERTKDCVFVAHNVRFDYSFIQEEFKNLGYTFSKKKLCTCMLAKKIVPGLKSYALKNLTSHFQIELLNHHRALDDAQATTKLLGLLMKMDGYKEETTNDFINQGIKKSQLPANISIKDLHALPERCGVYYFHDAEGQIIYVGKSINIQKRVMSHFATMTQKAQRLQQLVFEITFEETGSELIAMLYESIQIKALQPRVNHAQKRKTLPFKIVVVKNSDGFLSLQMIQGKIDILACTYIKSFRSKKSGERYIQWATREYGLCSAMNGQSKEGKACFLHVLGICMGVCDSQASVELYNQRVFAFIDSRPHFEDSNFLIVEEGRGIDEKGVVAVQDGEYYGFGYFHENDLNRDFEDLLFEIKSQEANDEVHSIIWHYLGKRKSKLIVI